MNCSAQPCECYWPHQALIKFVKKVCWLHSYFIIFLIGYLFSLQNKGSELFARGHLEFSLNAESRSHLSGGERSYRSYQLYVRLVCPVDDQ